jgi:hypothetical protein
MLPVHSHYWVVVVVVEARRQRQEVLVQGVVPQEVIVQGVVVVVVAVPPVQARQHQQEVLAMVVVVLPAAASPVDLQSSLGADLSHFEIAPGSSQDRSEHDFLVPKGRFCPVGNILLLVCQHSRLASRSLYERYVEFLLAHARQQPTARSLESGSG